MKKIVFLVSGSGGTLKFLYFALKLMKLDMEIVGILSDRECPALGFAIQKGVYQKQIKYNRNHVSELQSELDILKPDLIVTNIHKIIDTGTLNKFPDKFINLHYSLLPSYGGLIGMDTVLKAKEQNVGFVGGTCHLVNEEVDAGKIVQQGCFAVDWNDDDHVIDTVFKISSICLLGGIIGNFRICQSENTKQMLINDRIIYFSPALPFHGIHFDNQFWDLIKNN